jgi:hypothetical protein
MEGEDGMNAGCDVMCDMKDPIWGKETDHWTETKGDIRSTRGVVQSIARAPGMAAQVQRQDLPRSPSLIIPLSHLYLPLVTALSQTTPSTMVT